MSAVHPDKRNVHDHVKQVIHTLRTGKTDMFQLAEPVDKKNVKWVVNNYQAIHEEDNIYRGINEIVIDFWPIVKKYLEMTGQKLVDDPNSKVDANASASTKEEAATETPAVDASASASESETESQPAPAPATQAPAVDADASASEEDAPAQPEVDADASASK